ncbi:hypothetical protein Prudu_012636 [Prunus dulcis]|uniref:Uncharacterized protein n=1 Tax=Prunus dulcis TaxID=3755 RepID=A0A4Y1RDB3_PRUDU|nr:hypothetical protein Prudu_012636 [Prunus dulcis]
MIKTRHIFSGVKKIEISKSVCTYQDNCFDVLSSQGKLKLISMLMKFKENIYQASFHLRDEANRQKEKYLQERSQMLPLQLPSQCDPALEAIDLMRFRTSSSLIGRCLQYSPYGAKPMFVESYDKILVARTWGLDAKIRS